MLNYRTTEGTGIRTRIVWDVGFSQRLLELVLKDISGFIYERV